MSETPKTKSTADGPNQPGDKEALLRLLAEFDTAMLVTLEDDGAMRARPMALQQERLRDCDLWLVSADETAKTDEIERHRQINLCCVRSRDRAYVSLSARARIERNPSEVRRLWQADWKIWFGDEKPEDGGIVLLKLDIERADYWDPEGGRPRLLYQLSAADAELAASDAAEPGADS
jgi:general stress protein 26